MAYAAVGALTLDRDQRRDLQPQAGMAPAELVDLKNLSADPSDAYRNVQLNGLRIHGLQPFRQNVAMFPVGFDEFPRHVSGDFNRFRHGSSLRHQTGKII